MPVPISCFAIICLKGPRPFGMLGISSISLIQRDIFLPSNGQFCAMFKFLIGLKLSIFLLLQRIAIIKTTFNSIILNSFILHNQHVKSMNREGFNLKKGFMFFHIVSGVLAACAVLIFILSGKYSWVYKLFLGCFILSGVTILAIFFKTLSRLQHLYFEIIFSVPLLIAAFLFLTWLFEYYFFGK
jgi:hypothetical protein